jgi:hypothetical protein
LRKGIVRKSTIHNGFARFLTNPCSVFLAISIINLFIMLDGQMSNDEGIWNYIGRVWCQNSIPPYIGTIENKTPAIFELFALSNILFGINYYFVRVLGLMAICWSSLTLYAMGRKFHSPFAGIFSMIIFGLTMAWGSLDGPHTSQTETFMNLFSILAFYLLMRGAGTAKWKRWVCMSGISMGLAIAFKQIAITTAFGLTLFFIIYNAREMSNKNICTGLVLLALGVAVSTFMSIAPLLLSGVSLKDYVDGAWLILMNQGSHTSTVRHMREFVRVFTNSKLAIFYPFLYLFILQYGLARNRYFIGLLVWLLVDFMGTNASGYYFGHQIKQLIPSLSLVIGILLSNLLMMQWADKSVIPRYANMVVIALFLLLFPFDAFIDNAYHLKHFDETKVTAMEMGIWLRDNTSNEDYVYIVAGGGNPILCYSERISPSRYFNTLFVTSPHERAILLSDIKTKSPLYILLSKRDPFYKNIGGNIERYIKKNYRVVYSYFGYDVLRRN